MSEDIVEQFRREAKKIVEDSVAIAKSQGYGKTVAISEERVKEIAASLEHLADVLPGDRWYMSAKPHKSPDTRYRDRDPYAFWASTVLIERFSEAIGVFTKSSPRVTVTPWAGYEGVPDEVFHTSQLIDTELGAPEKLNLTKSEIVQDPAVLARKMPGRNVGYTKNGIKPKCPVHQVTVTELGQCPVCYNNVVIRHNERGDKVARFNTEDFEAYDEYVKPSDIRVYIKNEGEKLYTDIIQPDTEWLKDEPIGVFNFVGLVNKKSDGRCNRTGDIGDPKSPLYMQQYRHTPSLKLDYNVEYTRVEGEEPRYTGNDIPVSRVKATLRECECGCKVTLKELRRGDKLCPQCGLVLGKTMVSQTTSRGGSDDVEYGGE